jgi:hypothetical protein
MVSKLDPGEIGAVSWPTSRIGCLIAGDSMISAMSLAFPIVSGLSLKSFQNRTIVADPIVRIELSWLDFPMLVVDLLWTGKMEEDGCSFLSDVVVLRREEDHLCPAN